MFSKEDLRKLIVPLVIEQVLVMLVGMADTGMVSHAGEAAVSGVSLVDTFAFMLITVLSALATGGAVIVSQYLGDRDPERANQAASQLQTITVVISLAIMAVCLMFHRQVLRLLFGAIEPDVMEASTVYLVITAFSFPFLGAYNSSAALFRSMGKTKATMYVSLLMNGINVVGNAVGVFVLQAGVAGVAVPTLLSRMVAGIVMTALAFQKSNKVFLRWRKIFSWDGKQVRRILRIAVPNAIENGLFALGRVLVTSIVALFGTTQIAANGVANILGQMSVFVANAINLAMVTVVGQCVGAKEFGQASLYTKKLMKISYVSIAVLGPLECLLMPVILHFFALSPEANSLTILLVALHNFPAIAIHPTSFNLSNSLRAAGDARFTMVVGVSSMILFRMGTAVVLGIWLNLGVIGVTIAMVMDWLARSVAFLLRFRSGKWKAFRAI